MTLSWSLPAQVPTITGLKAAYDRGIAPSEVIAAICDRMDERGDDAVWIHRVAREDLLDRARALETARPGPQQPLWGVPFSVKDCNDVPGMPTTNALPAMRYVADSTGPAIRKLLDAGAICLGKTNMDQFGIGLVGMRSPFGAPASVFSDAHISGGSSSGSGVAVALGLGAFSIANDAAGSGRVPAAFNNIVGLKPTPGLISNSCVSGGGCVKTLETVSVFALSVDDAMTVTRLIAGFDKQDPFSNPLADTADLRSGPPPQRFAFGIPAGDWLRFFGDTDAANLFEQAVARLEVMGGTAVPIDFAPFDEVQRILYDGPWIAERALSLDPIVAEHREHIHPVTLGILESAGQHKATDVFRAIHRIAELKRDVRPVWDAIDTLVVPTTPTIFTKAEISADPIGLNSQLGIYTNFVNLMGLSAVAVPNGFRPDGLPQGATFLAPGFAEGRAARIAAAFHDRTGCGTGIFVDHALSAVA